MTVLRGALTLATLACIAGCASAQPQSVGIPTLAAPTPTSSVTPEPTFDPDARLVSTSCDVMLPDSVGRPTLCELVLSPDGLGPVRLGQPVPVQEAHAAIASSSIVMCGDVELRMWEPNYPETPRSNPTFYIESFSGASENAPIEHIYVWSELVRTAEGVGTGSTLAAVKSAYGDQLTYFPAQPSGEFDAYALRGSVGQLVFWVATYEPERISGVEVFLGYDAPGFAYELGCS